MRSSTQHLLKGFVRKLSCESGGNGPDEAKGKAAVGRGVVGLGGHGEMLRGQEQEEHMGVGLGTF